MRSVPGWDEYFMRIAETYAVRSKDPRHQIGCVLVNAETHTIKSGGYNGMVAGTPETDAVWERPAKDNLVCHAEFNAVATAARHGISVCDCRAYITRFPCIHCTRLLIQAGIDEIIYPEGSASTRFVEEIETAHSIIVLAGVKLLALKYGLKG